MRKVLRHALSLAMAASLAAGCAAQAAPPGPTAQPYVPPPSTPSPFPTAVRVNAPLGTPAPGWTNQAQTAIPQAIDPQLFVSTDRTLLTREAEAGLVVVEVTPLNWPPQPGGQLSFEVALNTHAVDLSYDLSQMAALRTSNFTEAKPLGWDGPTTGGHHVAGTLTFPPLSLGDANWVELDIYDVASVSVRTFHWDAIDFQ